MKVKAVTKYLRISPKKLRMRGDTIKGMKVEKALPYLQYEGSKSGRLLFETLKSAIFNAINNHGIDPETIVVENVTIGEGPRLKRIKPRARGRADRMIRPSSHIFVTVEGEVISKLKKVESKLLTRKISTKDKKKIEKSDPTKLTKDKSAPKTIGKTKKGAKQSVTIRKEEM